MKRTDAFISQGSAQAAATAAVPRLSIGLPVYNGERYLAPALDSLLAQTYTDFELILSDNGSSDGTQEICLRYADRDSRIRYYRQPQNLGAVRNHNFTIEQSRGEFFKWASHDDLYRPTFVERCIELLDASPNAVLAFSRTQLIDENGLPMRECVQPLNLAHPSRSTRFLNYVCASHVMTEDFGVIRSAILKRTGLLGNYVWSDMALFGELALYGPFLQVPELLFLRREHRQRAMQANRDAKALSLWNDPRKAGGSMLPTWRLLRGHIGSLWRTPLSLGERISMSLGAVRRATWTNQLGPELWQALRVLRPRAQI